MRQSLDGVLLALSLVALVGGVGTLIHDCRTSAHLPDSLYFVADAIVVLGPPAVWLFVRRSKRRSALRGYALAACVVAPLAVLGSWASMGLFRAANLRTYIHWLTKHPNLGPLNYEVLAGLFCVIGASLLPWLFVVYLRFARKPRRRVLTILVVGQLLAYLPLLSEIDARQLLEGAAWLLRVPFFGVYLLIGAFGRLNATVAMFTLWRAMPRARPNSGLQTDERRHQ